ncbi:hypothetical protein Pmani_025759 [Petrolisthes manimaculis]|uniref:Uncharacterized protein n=1 Tax=Petrolisthes manimaculis TaxID=1843537 RepID=A0AAE1TYM3_9EUCA|nr:hypothetical protein Pmani_025748 [Petrolisthes manimaculis]KAK4302151.1 hypothetical protein Pmani_025759 [Petrolisthes manimaculis]
MQTNTPKTEVQGHTEKQPQMVRHSSSMKRVPLTDQDGGLSPPGQPLPLMGIGDSNSLRQGTDVTGQHPPQSKTQTFSVTPVGTYVLPASDCGATCIAIAECMDYVIIGSRWTTKKKNIL